MKKIILGFLIVTSILTFSEPIRKLSVTGNAEKEVMPDIAKISFRVYTKDEDLKKASQENTKNLENFKSDLKKKNISVSDIKTYNYYTQKTTENNNKEDKKTKYNSTLYFSVKVSDLSKIPDLMSLAESNKIKSLKNDSEDKSIYYGEINRSDLNKDKAISEAFKTYDNVKSQLSSFGINSGDISVYSYSAATEEVIDNETSKEKTYHNIYNDFTIELKDISKINEVIKLAENNKINVQGQIAFDISNKEQLESELYNKAYEQTKAKATSILKSSEMSLGDPLVVSESVSYQNMVIQQDYNYTQKINNSSITLGIGSSKMYESEAPVPKKVDYKPQAIKLTQNVSVLYEMK